MAFPAIMWFYHETLKKNSFKIIIRIFTVTFLVLAFILGFQQGFNVFNYNTWTLHSILVTITSFFFIADLNLMEESNFSENPHHKTNILLNTSLALYYFITIVLFGVSEYIDAYFTPEDNRYFWSFHNMVHVLKNVGLTVAFYLTVKTQPGTSGR